MKITDIKTILLKEWRTMLFVQVETDEGITGIGESGLTSRELAVEGMVEHFKPLLIGKDPFKTEHHWQTMWRSGFHPGGLVASSAIAAIDIALWDIKGKKLNVPVFELLGGRTRDKVLTYCHIGGLTPEKTLEMAQERVNEGWKCLRLEPTAADDNSTMDGRWAVDKLISEFKLLREKLGDEIELAVDAHTKLTPAEAKYLCQFIAPYRPIFVEDALRSEFVEGYRVLRQNSQIPFAAGEQFSGKWNFRTLIEENLIDYARVDICIAGGITEAKKIAAMCETHMIDLAVHNPIGPVSTAACLHLNLSCSNVLIQELPKRPAESVPDLILTDQIWHDGYLNCEGKPGLGVELNEEFLSNYPFEAENLPMLKKLDGSYTNW